MALLANSPAHAEFLDRIDIKPALVSGFVSHHIAPKQKFNEDNCGIGYRFADSDVIVGYYRNSEYRNSICATYEARWELTDNLHAGVLAGAVTGYRWAVTPLVLPEVVVRVGRIELAATYIPKIDGHTPALTALQARWGW